MRRRQGGEDGERDAQGDDKEAEGGESGAVRSSSAWWRRSRGGVCRCARALWAGIEPVLGESDCSWDEVGAGDELQGERGDEPAAGRGEEERGERGAHCGCLDQAVG